MLHLLRNHFPLFALSISMGVCMCMVSKWNGLSPKKKNIVFIGMVFLLKLIWFFVLGFSLPLFWSCGKIEAQ